MPTVQRRSQSNRRAAGGFGTDSMANFPAVLPSNRFPVEEVQTMQPTITGPRPGIALNPFAVAILLAVHGCPQIAHAQAETGQLNRHVEVVLHGTPGEVVSALHRQTDLDLIADGGFGADVIDVKISGTLGDALKALAEQLDCRVKPQKSGMFVLSRRFRRPDALPQANLDELRQTAKDALRGLSAFTYAEGEDEVWAPMVRTLAQSLTPDQAAALQRGEQLEVTALAAPQRDLVTQALLTRAFGGIKRAWGLLSLRLGGRNRAVLRTQDTGGNGVGHHYMCGLVVPGIEGGVPAIFGE